MSMEFLYEKFDAFSELGNQGPIKKEKLNEIVNNLNHKFSLRPYQNEAFSRFVYYFTEYPSTDKPSHLLFNMATGSGKTLIMAGLILYLYSKGYNNFLFFVNQDNIIKKTKDNFLNKNSSKYLFNETINFNGKAVQIKEVTNFQGASENNINICFTTIQKLHIDLNAEKENSITIEDFKNDKIVLLADESHHLQVEVKKKKLTQTDLFLKENWENTVQGIFKQNENNLLLEFTATMDFMHNSIKEKYLNKVIYRYDLKQFRNDGYSKDIDIFQSDSSEKKRILQALILNQYRQAIAAKHYIDLKPVILFKAQRTITQSEENEKKFNSIIENLNENNINSIRQRSNTGILAKAFIFFDEISENKNGNNYLVRTLKRNFSPDRCMNVNNGDDIKKYQLALNSLEDKDNQIRAIFAVQKLNEGWDVLNLFDIVRLYNTRDAKNNKPGTTTISEAQLIGRGARYFPFQKDETQERYKRKYDDEPDNELRIIEQIHYHSFKNSEYISELKTALINQGALDNTIQRELNLKESFLEQEIYKKGVIYLNGKIKSENSHVRKFEDLQIHVKNTLYDIHSGGIIESKAFGEGSAIISDNKKPKNVSLEEIYKNSHVIQNAIARHNFFTFKNLKTYFPYIKSIKEFITGEDYMGTLNISFIGLENDIEDIENIHYLNAILKLLDRIEIHARENTTEYKGTTEFESYKVKEIFKNTTISISPEDTVRLDGQQDVISKLDWYAFDANHGTTEEKEFVNVMDEKITDFQNQGYTDIYVIRNEGHFKIHNFNNGKGFQPDFVLFMNDKNKQALTYQFYIEPKGKHIMQYDGWKQDFLLGIRNKAEVVKIDGGNDYDIVGLPFFNGESPNLFTQALDKELE